MTFKVILILIITNLIFIGFSWIQIVINRKYSKKIKELQAKINFLTKTGAEMSRIDMETKENEDKISKGSASDRADNSFKLMQDLAKNRHSTT